MIEQYVVDLQEVDETLVAVVGGKAAQLGGLSRIEGVRVPAGFCVTTAAFRRIMAEAPSIGDRLDRLSRLDPDDREAIRTLSAEIRRTVEGIAVPDDLAAAITRALARLGGRAACAVRSSATAEDLPTASFAGQQDTYLNVVGPAAVLRHVSRCWASLFTERAVTYRLRNGFDHRKVRMAVIVQRMVFPDAAGVLFTADPVTGDRKVATVEAGFGLGEALVSGLVNPDVFKVRDGEVVAGAATAGRRAVHAPPAGGTREAATAPQRQGRPALTEAQVVRLVRLGRRIEAHFGRPQDIEWCLADDDFQIVQSRPITTLFPAPAPDPAARDRENRENRVYVSVGHQQMMTDPMRPLGLSMWQLTAMVPMHEAGGRLFVDVTPRLASPASRAGLLDAMGRGDPLVRDALETVLGRRGFVPTLPDGGPGGPGGSPAGGPPAPIETDPAIVTGLIERSRASLAALRRDIRTKTGPALFDFLLEAFQEHKRVLGDPLNMQVIMAGMEATWWLNDRLQEWLGEKNAADALTLSAPGNVTSEMGLALLDVADVIRPHPEVVAFLQGVADDGFLDELPKFAGGAEARRAIESYLDRYGMRCVGEIDITRPRWRERPATLVPAILDNVRNFEPGAAGRRFERGRREARKKAQEVLERLRALPDGERKAAETERMIDRVRTFIGYREYPKYDIVSRYLVYKEALLEEAGRLVRAGVLPEGEDVFYLTFQEFHDAVRSNRVDEELIRRRKEEFRSYHALTPPRVLTSDGEAVTGAYRRDDVPTGALTGLPVSAGTVEGRARVVLDMARADLEPGDILVTAHTDPSWTPLFVTVAGLVTEVGGLMTHGAVIAREYGLPAVVGVVDATRLISDGQRIRVHGSDGYVEILP
ncbi:rifamycin-inactivating phosphotransferase [Planomonospora parontospora]|uniref:rifamycin-inactivating phosphotransferase n=1 Tax=Planomonospora parontospora TaxID=58119 RepID=UPI0016705196|nr:rifamycin-inactivating phosphotransferase [Planomonospora parontospora]GGL54198.1 putative phosphoenolpyruvate synthase [Planomonospora parontospora subsp. antibiotica]GII19710.1 putative phosphoenolpyruvate synthase [Planomonospora parontospora subsp. antibiotica]